MAQLGDAQYRAVLDFVGEIHDAQDLDELRAMVLTALRRMVPADYSSYNEIPSGEGEHVTLAEPAVPPFAHEVWERLAPTNPLVERFARTRDGRPYRFSDVIPQAELRQMPIYRELYRELGVEHQIAFVLPSRPTLLIGVALSRGGTRDFGDDERTMLDLIRPHLIQTYRNAQLRQRTDHLLAAISKGLDARGTAALVVDERREVVLATAEGERLCGALTGLDSVVGKPLPTELVATFGGDGPVASVADRGGDTVLAHRVAAPERMTVLFLERATRVLTPETLGTLGLTPREASVLATLARGRSTDETAHELDISPRTVLKHAERIHRKLGVRNRAQAIATAWTAAEVGSED
jgi:DNA-binding CsgD family transcriptional regulator